MLTFAPGVTNQTIAVPVIGNILIEPDKSFLVQLSNPVNGVLGRTQATATILNDDGLPGDIYTLKWDAISSPKLVNGVIAATLQALDASSQPATNFNGSVAFSATGAGGSDLLRLDFENGLQGCVINNSNGSGHGLWHLSTGRGANPGHSATTSLYYGQGEGASGGGNYNTGTANGGVVTLPAVSLPPGSGSLALTFNYLMNVEVGAAYDQAVVELSTNLGSTYQTLEAKTNGLTNLTQNLWITNSVSLARFAGQNVLLRFRFDTIDSVQNTTEGWYVDDVAIRNLDATPIAMSPGSSGAFTNGRWSGGIVIPSPATNVVARADDGQGHSGVSNPFTVAVSNDLALSVTASPNPAVAGGAITYILTVANSGPDVSTSVTVTNTLGAGATFGSATSSQGTCAADGGVVRCDLGSIAGGSNATVTIVATPWQAGAILTNTAAAGRAEPDDYPADNVAATTTIVSDPRVSLADASQAEGNVGAAAMYLTAALAAPSAKTVTVQYTVADGTAHGGQDFGWTNGTLTFAPGATQALIAITIFGNTNIEGDKTFTVILVNPVNATLGRSLATATIVNDDGLPGQIYGLKWDAIASPQVAGIPFVATLRAVDAGNQPATNFNGTAALSAPGQPDLAPGATGVFTNGVWSGFITLTLPGSNTVLRADDGQGHLGYSGAFAVVAVDDLSLAVSATASPVFAGSRLNYVLTVANAGPDAATGVTLTNTLPAGVAVAAGGGLPGGLVVEQRHVRVSPGRDRGGDQCGASAWRDAADRGR